MYQKNICCKILQSKTYFTFTVYWLIDGDEGPEEAEFHMPTVEIIDISRQQVPL